MKILLWILLLVGFTAPAMAQTTWYIRKDGGTVTQCTGTTNAAYPGSGSGIACAFIHPFHMMNSTGGWAHMVGGDTIQFVNTSGTSDTYFMGEQNAGVGTDWHTQLSGICPAANNTGTGNAFACTLPPPPSGTSGAHTKIIGQNAGSCHDSGHTHLVNPTILDGIGNPFGVLQFVGTNFVDVSCIEVTQNDKCTQATGTGITTCTNHSNDTMNFVGGGGGGGIILNNIGTTPQQFGPSNLTMTDVAVVGIASSGIFGANINHLDPAGTTTFTDVYVIGNGFAGWNGDGGCGNSAPNNVKCENQGTVNRSHVIVDWSGCVPATYPYDMTKADTANAFDWCADAGGGGYGDGFVQIASGNEVSNIDHSFFRWNTQDGYDGLHLSDDSTTNPNIHITTSWSEGNEGATFKIGGASVSSAINNVSIGNCRVLATASNFPLNPTNWNQNLAQLCRASGDEWTFQMNNNTVVTVENNTSVGYGATMYDLECNTFSTPPNTTCSASGGKILFNNNISKGYTDPGTGTVAEGFFFGAGVTTASFSNTASNNLWNTMKTATGCPDSAITSPVPINSQCGDPLLVGESNINAINPNITNGSSPALGHGLFISGYTTDYNGNTVTNPPQIGAFAQTGGTPTAATPTFSPVAGTYGSAQTVTISTTSGTVICTNTTGAPATNGTTGCTTGTLYTTPVSVPSTETLFAVAGGTGLLDSTVGSAAYTITLTVANPTASPVAGTYSSVQTVALNSTTSGAAICYTTDGTTPLAATAGTCSHGTQIANGATLSVAVTETVKAIGTLASLTNSGVSSFAYTITLPTPNLTIFGTVKLFGTGTYQ